MRALRLSLAGLVIVCLLVGLSVGALAQDDVPAAFTPVSGTVSQAWGFSEGSGYSGHQETVEGGVLVGQGFVEHQEVAWSDPRLPSTMWIRMDYRIHDMDDDPDGVMTVTTSHLLVGDEGSWRGTGRAVEDAESRYSTYELVGEGAYEGLYALLQGTPGIDVHGPWDESYVGYILEGMLPPFPDPAEPLDIEGIQQVPFPTEPPSGG